MTDEQKAKLSRAHMGHTVSPETRKKISLINTGRTQSLELRNRKSATLMGHAVSTETRAKISLGNRGNTGCLGYRHSAEELAKMSSSQKGKIVSLETRAKISISGTGNANAFGHRCSEEAKGKMSMAQTQRMGIPETRARLSAATKATWAKPEMRAKFSAAHWMGGRAVSQRKHDAKRRGLGHVYLNEWFLGCDGHHVDNEQIICMPRALHRGKGKYHNHSTGRGMDRMNAAAYGFLFKQEVESAIG